VDTLFPQAEQCATSVLFSLAFSLGMLTVRPDERFAALKRGRQSLFRLDRDGHLSIDTDAEMDRHLVLTE